MHFCSMNTLLTWHGVRAHERISAARNGGSDPSCVCAQERNYRGVVPIQGDDPYADEGYTTPGVGAKLEEESKPDNRLLPRLDTVPPVGLGDGADAAAQAGGSGYE